MQNLTLQQRKHLVGAAHNLWQSFIRPKGSKYNTQSSQWELPSSHPVDKLWFKHPKSEPAADSKGEGIALPKRKIWLPTKNPTAVPGGDFEESYYWDSLLIANGLIRSPDESARAIAKCMVDNFLDAIETWGFVPNTNMPSYLTRSQPPVLSSMVKLVFEKHSWKGEATKFAWLRKAVSALEKEYAFWTSGLRMTEFDGLSRYADNLFDEAHVQKMFEVFSQKYLSGGFDSASWEYATGSRKGESLESSFFRLLEQDDQFHTRTFEITKLTDAEKTAILHRRAACESGADYTLRALPDHANEYGRMHDLVAVDLNSLLAVYERHLSEFYVVLAGQEKKSESSLGMKQKSDAWLKKFDERRESVNSRLYSKKNGGYYDYDLKCNQLSGFPSAFSFLPLFAGLAGKDEAGTMALNAKILLREYGLATSLAVYSPWQWDGNIGWACLQHFAAVGLLNYGYEKEALSIMNGWLKGAYAVHQQHGVFLEKMDVSSPLGTDSKRIPSQGRYGTLAGFGWTNGSLILFNWLLEKME